MSSPSDSSTSSVEIVAATSPRFASAAATDTSNMDSSAAASTAARGLSGPVAERLASSLRTQRAVDDVCRKYGVSTAYTARPAGQRRACTPPQDGAVCVYEHALEAGICFQLNSFFCEALEHFGLAPGQLAPNGWRILAAFVLLCQDARVPASLAVFRHFFMLGKFKVRGWYFFRGKDTAGALFTGLPSSKRNKGWKSRFFFLTAPEAEPWPFPVTWGEPPRSNSRGTDLVLTSEDHKSLAKLLSLHRTAVDLQTYVFKTKLSTALSSSLAGESPPPQPPQHSDGSSGAKGILSFNYPIHDSSSK